MALKGGVKVLDLAKQEVEVKSLWASQPIVLALIRRFG
jgi:hypothetical protein